MILLSDWVSDGTQTSCGKTVWVVDCFIMNHECAVRKPHPLAISSTGKIISPKHSRLDRHLGFRMQSVGSPLCLPLASIAEPFCCGESHDTRGFHSFPMKYEDSTFSDWQPSQQNNKPTSISGLFHYEEGSKWYAYKSSKKQFESKAWLMIRTLHPHDPAARIENVDQ